MDRNDPGPVSIDKFSKSLNLFPFNHYVTGVFRPGNFPGQRVVRFHWSTSQATNQSKLSIWQITWKVAGTCQNLVDVLTEKTTVKDEDDLMFVSRFWPCFCGPKNLFQRGIRWYVNLLILDRNTWKYMYLCLRVDTIRLFVFLTATSKSFSFFI